MEIYKILRKIVKTTFFSIKFFLTIKKDEALLASLPRSGTHLTFGLLNICYAMKLGYEGKLGVIDNAYTTFAKLQMPFDERSIFYKYTFPHLWHSHLPYFRIVPLRKKFCNTIVLIREPVQGIQSFILHVLNDLKTKKNLNKEISLKDFLSLDKKYKFINHYSQFLDSWRKRKIDVKNNSIIILDHEIVIKNVHNYLLFLNNFFNFKFTKLQMKTAANELNINRIKKISSKKSIRITKQKLKLSKEVEKYIKIKCEKKYLDIFSLCSNKKITKKN